MKSPYRSWRWTTSRDSGAGEYSQPVGIAAVSGRCATSRLRSVNREVVRVLVSPGALFANRNERVVGEGGRAEPIAIRREPGEAERLVHLDEVLHRLLRLTDAASRLHPDNTAGLLVDVADHLEHAELYRESRGDRKLARRRLDEVGAAGDREEGCAAHVVVGAKLAGLEDDLEMRAARADLLHTDDLVVHRRVASRKEGAAIDDHVDLVRAGVDDLTRFEELHLERGLPRGERGGDRGDLHALSFRTLDRVRHEVRIDADRRDRWDVRIRWFGTDALRRERGDLAQIGRASCRE